MSIMLKKAAIQMRHKSKIHTAVKFLSEFPNHCIKNSYSLLQLNQ